MVTGSFRSGFGRGGIGSLSMLLVAAWLQGAVCWTAVAEEPPAARPPFATIGVMTQGGDVITAEQFDAAVQMGMRQKFYHGKVPPDEFAKYQREVGAGLIDRLLLVKEAKRLGLQPNQEEIKQAVAQYDKRYASSDQWRQNREKMVGPLTKELEEQSLVKQLEKQARDLPASSEEEVQAYYRAHPDKVTRPEQRQLSLILLRVDPSGGPPAWEMARQEATGLLEKLKKGADFAELAKIHSGDTTAEQGGRMEAVHKGSLATPAEEAIAKLTVGQLTDPPVTILEGIAIFRLDQILPARLMPFADVKERVAKLLAQERSDQAWDGLKKRLRGSVEIKINEQSYHSLGEGDKLPPRKQSKGK